MAVIGDIIDNPMYSKSQSDDPQCWDDEETFKCDYCGDNVPISDKVRRVDRVMCSDCVGEYCKDKARKFYMTKGFIEEHEEEFYIDYYFNNIEPREKLELIKSIYKIHSLFIDGTKDTYFDEIEKEFCLEHDYFFDYLRGAI